MRKPSGEDVQEAAWAGDALGELLAFGKSLKPRAWLRSSGERVDKGPRTLSNESWEIETSKGGRETSETARCRGATWRNRGAECRVLLRPGRRPVPFASTRPTALRTQAPPRTASDCLPRGAVLLLFSLRRPLLPALQNPLKWPLSGVLAAIEAFSGPAWPLGCVGSMSAPQQAGSSSEPGNGCSRPRSASTC